jgi:hypothetical protein
MQKSVPKAMISPFDFAVVLSGEILARVARSWIALILETTRVTLT